MKTTDLITKTEEELLENTIYYPYISDLLRYRQFSEDFLIKTIHFYNSWICLKFQKKLSPYFCFRYLYDNSTDNSDDWTSYNDIQEYFKESDFTTEDLERVFAKAMRDRGR